MECHLPFCERPPAFPNVGCRLYLALKALFRRLLRVVYSPCEFVRGANASNKDDWEKLHLGRHSMEGSLARNLNQLSARAGDGKDRRHALTFLAFPSIMPTSGDNYSGTSPFLLRGNADDLAVDFRVYVNCMSNAKSERII